MCVGDAGPLEYPRDVGTGLGPPTPPAPFLPPLELMADGTVCEEGMRAAAAEGRGAWRGSIRWAGGGIARTWSIANLSSCRELRDLERSRTKDEGVIMSVAPRMTSRFHFLETS
jgi:hypothetical protein